MVFQNPDNQIIGQVVEEDVGFGPENLGVPTKEISAEGKSIFAHDPGGKVAESYKNLTQEVTKLEKQREKSRAGIGR